MTVTNTQSGTHVHEIAAGVYRISTPIAPSQMPGGFTFNQFLIVDDAPLLHHTGPRRMFPLVREAVAHVLGDVAKLRYVSLGKLEQRASKVVMMSFLEERSADEIASALSINAGNVRVIRHRALGSLRECLESSAAR